MTLATCGKDLKFYDWPGLRLSGLYETFEECMSIKNISWCNDGTAVVAIRNNDNPVIIKRPANIENKLETEVYIRQIVSTGCFSNTSNTSIAFGTLEGNLYIFDIKKKRKINEYHKIGTPVCFIDFSHEDTSLAAGCSNGQIILYNSNPQPCASYSVPYSHSLSAMLFNKTLPNILAGGSKEGLMAVWNTDVGTLLCNGKHHNGVITDIAFFGDNLTTVGSDGKFLVYDLKAGNEPVTWYNLNSPLSGVDCLFQNYDVAISTCDGQLRSYDRRHMSSPINTVIDFNCSIKKICFSPTSGQEATNSRPISEEYKRKGLFESFMCKPSGDFNILHSGNTSSDELKEVKSYSVENSYFNDLLPPSASEVDLVNNSIPSAEEMNKVLGTEELLKKNKQYIENKLLAEFYDLRIQISKQFIELQQKIEKSWDGFINHLKILNTQTTQSENGENVSETTYARAETKSVRSKKNRRNE